MMDYLQERFVFTQMLIKLDKLMLDVIEEAAKECVFFWLTAEFCGIPRTC